jgi:hypothetical protein
MVLQIMKTVRASQNGMEVPMDGNIPEEDDLVADFVLDHFVQDFQREEMVRCRTVLQPNMTLPHPPPPASNSTTMHLEVGGNSAQGMNSGGHILPDQCPPGGNLHHSGGASQPPPGNRNISGMIVYPNGSTSMPSRQVLNMKMMSPSTPPATPPEGSPPHCQIPSSPNTYPSGQGPNNSGAQTPQTLVDSDGQQRHQQPPPPQHMVNEEHQMWHPSAQGPPPHLRFHEQPMDLRPHVTSDCQDGMEGGWIRKYEYHHSHAMQGFPSPQPPMGHHHGQHLGLRMSSRDDRESRDSFDTRDSDSYCPAPRGSGGGSGNLSDDQLIALPVRELNKKLHGLPRELVQKLKQKRRTLKNRGYAQNCRTKRLHQRNQLEEKNRILQKELHRVVQERDSYKSKFEILRRQFHQQNNNNSNQINANNQSGLMHSGPGMSGGGNPSNHPNGPIHANNNASNHNHCNGNNNNSSMNNGGIDTKPIQPLPAVSGGPGRNCPTSPRSPAGHYY